MSTSNGGQIWILDTNFGSQGYHKENLSSLECTAPHHGFLHGREVTLSIIPGRTSIFGPPEPDEANYGAYLTLAEKMYDTAHGFRLVELLSAHDPNEYDDSVIILVTHDGWHSSKEYGAAFILTPDTTYAEMHSEPMFTGYIVDSNDIWTAAGSLNYRYNKIIHTTNAGTLWETSNIFGALVSQTQVKDLFVNAKSREAFYLCNLGASEVSYSSSDIDFAYSSDYGSTWRLDSTFGVRLWRLANPAPGILWAMIGQSGSGENGANVEIYPPQDVQGAPNDYCSKIAYSSNNGATWLIDSTTFVDDSLEEMHFIDARHGWIASWSHDSLFMWYYDADAMSDVAESVASRSDPMFVLPNPAQTSITVKGAGKDLEIFDALGRSFECPRNGSTLDISRLPAGVYYVIDGGSTNDAPHRTRFVKD
ncbi:MAG: T9SS type A sorting domain-containing protein [Bacteroidota bacterium]|nr:T9SS type A sorting domain-containing protein [Bacteroidota bacterium]